MNQPTIDQLIKDLLDSITEHPYREELLNLTQDQLSDDTTVIVPEVFG